MLNRSVATLALIVTFAYFCESCDSNEKDNPDASDASDGSDGSNDIISAAYPANGCVSAKQRSSGAYCKRVFEAWATWEAAQDDNARDNDMAKALTDLETAWSDAEDAAKGEGSDCADHALAAKEAADELDGAISELVESINSGLDLDKDSQCGVDLLVAAADACSKALIAESEHIADPGADADGAALAKGKKDAFAAFSSAWAEVTSNDCPTDATKERIRDAIDKAVADIVLNTIVAANLDDSQFTTISPTGTTEYLGKELTPICMDGSDYHFFVKRGTVNKLLMYYQGGGACWENITCSIPVCDSNVDPEGTDNPNNSTGGFADRDNPDNPFRDWHQVFVSYCSCDLHFGDAAQDYSSGIEQAAPTHVEHRGFHNSRYVEKWAREHFLNPEVVFVSGTSAGAYGAVFAGALLHYAWPASRFHILGDAGNGVITKEFLANEFGNWNFAANIPDNIPGVLEAITGGEGMVAYIEAVATEFPATNWAHYATAYDGGPGGQSGFYNVMLNNNNPAAALTWWEASCAFNERLRFQVTQTYERVSSNYRYYIGTGTRHGMFGHDKVYSDTTGGVPTIVDWINAMLRSGPDGRDPEWTNVECTNCGLTLPGDPVPDPLEPPFEQQGDDLVVVCE